MRNSLKIATCILLLTSISANAELSDPTRPSYALPEAGEQIATSALRVSAVFISGDRKVAVVNGQRVRVGESIGGATVSGIDRKKVSFVRGDRTFTVSLLSGQSRQ